MPMMVCFTLAQPEPTFKHIGHVVHYIAARSGAVAANGTLHSAVEHHIHHPAHHHAGPQLLYG
jgi:hypothetical protein